MTHDEKPTSHPADVLALDPVYIPGMIQPVPTEGADVGVNHHLIHTHVSGLVVEILPYLNMQANDWIQVYWGDDPLPVTAGRVLPEHIGKAFALFVRPGRIPEGVNNLYATVTRSGGGNGGTTSDLGVLVRTLFPGGTDPDPSEPGHQLLAPPEPELPPGGIIDEDAAKAGVKVTIPGYRNMRIHDTVRLDWGGETVLQQVTQADVDADLVEILVPEAVILAAGDSDQLVLVYRIWDEVHNQSSDWSLRAFVTVEIGEGLFPAPAIENPDHNADPYDVIDLDQLGDDDLLVNVMVFSNGLLKGDLITLTWVGTNAEGQPVTFTPEPREVTNDPQVVMFIIPNDSVRGLARGHGAARYSVERDGSPAGASKRAFVTFTGVVRRLPKPEVRDAVNGVLDPTLDQTLVTVPGAALEPGDTVHLTWLGTLANGTPLHHTDQGGVSGGGAGKPMLFPIEAEYIAPLDGGTVTVSYRLNKGSSDIDLQSESEYLNVGDIQFQLPAPTTLPPAQQGVIDPDELPGQLLVIIPPWPDMAAQQTVHLVWNASSGPEHGDYMPISPTMVGKEVKFSVDQAKVEQYLDARIDLSYWVEIPGEASLTSASAVFSIGARELILPLPVIDEADGNELDPDTLPDGATIRIGAEAQFVEGDKVTVQVEGNGEAGSVTLEHTVPPGAGGEDVTLPLPFAVISANLGGTFALSYKIARAAGGPLEPSEAVTYSVIAEVGSGPFKVMGARFNRSVFFASRVPRMLSAWSEEPLRPARVEWRYEDEQAWVSATRWTDTKPWLKLFVRNRSETWECRYANIVGVGDSVSLQGYSAFIAIRDEVAGNDGVEVDMVGWGHPYVGGQPDQNLISHTTIAEVSSAGSAYAARVRNGNALCWGLAGGGGQPPSVFGPFEQIIGNSFSFVGRKTDGSLTAWGSENHGVPVPAPVLQHKDYVDLCAAHGAYATLRKTGQVVVWGIEDQGGKLHQGQDQLDGVIQLRGNAGAFVALRDNGTVFSWGYPSWGGLMPAEIIRLTNVRSLGAATMHAFTIILDTGEVKAWPYESPHGGTVPPEIARLRNIVEVTATGKAFCARLSTGQIVAWGPEDGGGALSEAAAEATNVVQVVGNHVAFAALCSDGTVIAWGPASYGGDTSAVADQLVNVQAIYANGSGFAALTSDGRVVTWGVPEGGGDSSKVQSKLRGKVTHSRLLPPAEADAVAKGGPSD